MANTPQTKMAQALKECGLPAKRIEVYGSQVMITAYSEAAARKWFRLLGQFTVSVKQPRRYAEYKQAKLSDVATYDNVWLVGGTI